MTRTLRLLLAEDNEDDELLVLRELRRNGYDVRHVRVQTAEAMRAALAAQEWDLVISDYSMPQFSAPQALAVLKSTGIDIPFIITSGTIGEETAVESLHAGAHDFLVKSRLARLAPAIERELRDADARRARRAAEADVARLEEQVRQTQKMEAIGRLAGGVAHDFNNILTAIIATADLALDAEGLPDEVKRDLDDIREAGHRAAAITRQLLTFSRKQVVQPRALDVNDVVRRNESMLKRLVPATIRIDSDLAATEAVIADPTQVEQVLLNLVINAADAMPAGGTIRISTSDVEQGEAAEANGRTLAAGRFVSLRVRDTGVGMDAETMSRIFEPFFTTKDPGRGTGLGLATVYGVVRQAGGDIVVDSTPGAGSTFDIRLPAASGVAPAPAESAAGVVLAGSEVILLVEDESPVRAPIARSLRQLGYFVLEAANGEDALRVLQEHHAPVHLLISDVRMPRMGGAELVGMLKDWYPHLKVLFISGYSEELAREGEALFARASYLAKPFTMDVLTRRVRDLLDGGEASPAARPSGGLYQSTP